MSRVRNSSQSFGLLGAIALRQQRLCGSGGVPLSPKLPYATLRAISHSRERRLNAILSVLFIAGNLGAVASPFGVWKNYTSMRDVNAVIWSADTIWAATTGGTFRFTAPDSSYLLITNSEGLSSNNLTAINLDTQGDIWFGSSIGTIDVYNPSNHSWKTIRDISLSNQPSKGIRAFLALGDTMLIGTDFGISVFRKSRWEFKDTFLKIGALPAQIPVTRIALIRDTLWVGTTQGVACAWRYSPLFSPSSWKTYQLADGLPSIAIRDLADSPRGVVAATSQGAAVFNGSMWIPLVPELANVDVVHLASGTNELLAATATGLIYSITTAQHGELVVSGLPSAPTALAADASGHPIVGVAKEGLRWYNTTASWKSILPNGPTSNLFSSLAVDDNGTLWVATGSNGRGTGFFSFDHSKWTSYTVEQYRQLRTNDYYHVSIGAANSKWFSSWGYGVALLDARGNLTVFTDSSAGFVGIPNDPKYVVIGGVAADRDGNTWMTVRSAANGDVIAVQRRDSTWKFFQNGYKRSTTLLTKLIIDPYGTKWIVSEDPQQQGLIYFNERGTIDDTADDLWGMLTTANGLISNVIQALAVDQYGDLWVGTDLGLNLIINPADPTAQGAISPYVFLRGIPVSSIAVDALNHKWVATPNGIVELSPDGTAVLNQYSVASTNGKLISNAVKDIAVDNARGIIYFGTEQGLSTLTTTAIAPVSRAGSLVTSPNPFFLPSPAKLVIDGLAAGSSIKILTVDGKVLKEFDTPGGRVAFWDGTDASGSLVPTGVYFVIAYTHDGEQIANGKVAVIRR